MTSVIDLIIHYQRSIEKSVDDKKRVLRCLDKLHQLGVTVLHLQETGVGRTVNALRKEPGEVGDAARALVNKWKNMVAEEADSSESDEQPVPPDHRGRDSPEESDHKNVSQSRHGGQVYQSDPETDNHYNKPQNGEYEKPHKRHHDSEDEDDRSKRSKLVNGDVSDEDNVTHKSDISPIRIKTEQSNSYDEHEDDDDEFSSENDISDDRSHELIKVKEEPISVEDVENHSNKRNKYSLNKVSNKSRTREEDSRSESSQTSKGKAKSDSRDKSEKGNDQLRQTDKESQGEKKESKRSSHKSSTSDRDGREKSSSSSDRHRSSDKHKCSEKDKNSSEKVYSAEKSSEKSYSKDKHKSSSEKHKSTNHKEKSRDDESRSSRLDKPKSTDSSSSRKEKTRDDESTSSHKDKHRSIAKDRSSESSSSHKEKHLKVESCSNKEKSRSSEGSSKSKHSEQSSSHSHKRNDDKKSRSSDNRHNSIDKALVEEEKRKSDKSSSRADTKQKGSSPRTPNSTNKDVVPKKKVRVRVESVNSDDGIDCESGASFAEALGMVSPVKAKKKSQGKDVSISSPSNSPATASTSNGFPVPASLLAPSTKLAPLPPLEISALPEISPHYKPRPPPRLLPQNNEEQALSFVMSNKNQRTKVFSGNKTYGKMSSLYDLCVNVLQEHIDALEYTGGVPYEILKPVVDRATPEQLFVLEHYNPYLMEDTNHLWQRHCERKFRNKQRHEMETWREMYSRCQDEQEARLKSLTANIKMAQEVRNAPTKQTKMAYVDSVVKPPRNIARKQAIHGTARAAVTSPAARVASLAGAGVVRAGTLPPRAAPSSSSSAAASAPSAAFKPKKAPLMQKALQFMRGRKR